MARLRLRVTKCSEHWKIIMRVGGALNIAEGDFGLREKQKWREALPSPDTYS